MKTAAPEQKSVKTLKGQLFGAVAMMLVAAIALGTSTYAWFINNSTVTVDPMQLSVSTSTSMTVAVGKTGSFTAPGTAANWTSYKALISNADIKGAGADQADWTKMFENKMVPASITDANLSTAKFFMSNGHVTADSKLDEFTALAKGTADNNAGQGPVKIIPLRFLGSQELDVFFGREDKTGDNGPDALSDIEELVTAIIDASGTDGAADPDKQAINDAQRDGIRKALRVAIVPKVDATYPDVEPVVFQFDDGTAHVTGAINNTKYAGDAPTTNGIGENLGKYAAISAVNTDSNLVMTDGLLTAQISGTAEGTAHDYIATVSASATPGDPATVTAGKKPLFTLQPNMPLDVDVYIWLEGTDSDCVSTLSEYSFNLDLPFAGVKPTPVAP